MKKYFFILLGLIIGQFSFGQTNVDPEEVTVGNIIPSDIEGVGYSFIFNNSSSDQTYTWQRNVINIAEGWTSAICDTNGCYFSHINSAELTILAGGYSNLDVHAYPNGFDGYAAIEVLVTNNNDAEDVASGMFYFNTSLSVPERITNALKIYPNPVVSEFFIEGADDVQRVEIYDISGKLVKEVQSFGQGSINVNDLGNGNYIVRMWNDANKQLSTNILTIQ